MPTGAVVEVKTFAFSDLALAPLDVVYGVERPPVSRRRAAPRRATSSSACCTRRARWRTASATQPGLRLQRRGRPISPRARRRSPICWSRRGRRARCSATARGADAEDLNPPSRAAAGAVDLAELEARAQKAEAALTSAQKALNTLVATGAAATADALRAALPTLGAFGLASAIPLLASGDDAPTRATLLAQASALAKSAQARLDQGAALRAVAAASDPRARRRQLEERIRAVFGSAFVTLPRFSCSAAAATELANALAASTSTQGGDALASHTWFARSARVRDPVAKLAACLRGAEVLATGDRLNLKVAQLPFVAGERWVGLPPAAGRALPAGKLSLVVHCPATALDPTQPLARPLGRRVDRGRAERDRDDGARRSSTTRRTPARHSPCCSRCRRRPDQAWTVGSLYRVLLETLDLAKLRAIDAESLDRAAHYLPGLYLAFNAKDDAVSTDFNPLTR